MMLRQRYFFNSLVFQFNDVDITIEERKLTGQRKFSIDYENIDNKPEYQIDRPLWIYLGLIFCSLTLSVCLIDYFLIQSASADFQNLMIWICLTSICLVAIKINTRKRIYFHNRDQSGFYVLVNKKNEINGKNICIMLEENRIQTIRKKYLDKYNTESIESYKDRIRNFINENIITEDEASDILKNISN